MTLLNDAGSPSAIPDKDHRGLVLSQPERGYRFSRDPFLLADFCRPRRNERIVDLGAGVGVIGLLLARRHPTVRVTGVEIQPTLARHAAENARLNRLQGRCAVLVGDLREAPRFLPRESFHRAVANPPYRKAGSGAAPPDPGRAGGRLDTTFTTGDLARTASALLRFGGRLDMIHLSGRLPEIFASLAAANLEPKQLRLIVSFPGAPAQLCLISAVKGGRPGLDVLPHLELHGSCTHAPSLGGSPRRQGPARREKASTDQ